MEDESYLTNHVMQAFPNRFAHRCVSSLAYDRPSAVHSPKRGRKRRESTPEVYLKLGTTTKPEDWDTFTNNYQIRKDYAKELKTRKIETPTYYTKKKEKQLSDFEKFKLMPYVKKEMIPLHKTPTPVDKTPTKPQNDIGELYAQRKAPNRADSLLQVLDSLNKKQW